MLLRNLRPVLRADAAGPELVDARLSVAGIVAVAPGLAPLPGEQVVDAQGRWAIPGLWDRHVHLGQWSLTRSRVDVSAARGPAEAAATMAAHLRASAPELLVGAGFRSPTWSQSPTVSALDAATGGHPVVLISGDCHHAWLNSAALALFGLPPRDGVLVEAEWFALMPRVVERELAQAGPAVYADAQRAAAARGVVGLVDYEFEPGFARWPDRYANAGLLRIVTSTYPDDLDAALALGLRTGDVLGRRDDGAPLLTMGPLKVISDGSLNTRTARVRTPYAHADGLADPCGVVNHGPDDLAALLARARAHGLEVALHAIGDAAVADALDAFAATGARGSIEHAQLVDLADLPRMAALGIVASVQPAHLLDDREPTARLWPDRADRCFAFASMRRAGVRLALGSDAPVAVLDPWLAMAAAVHRGRPGQDAWNPREALTPAQALAASVGGRLTPGDRADIVLLDADPLAPASDPAEAAARLEATPVAATIVASRIVAADSLTVG